jgi:hypothetical protein
MAEKEAKPKAAAGHVLMKLNPRATAWDKAELEGLTFTHDAETEVPNDLAEKLKSWEAAHYGESIKVLKEIS